MSKTVELHPEDSEIEQTEQSYAFAPESTFHLDLLDYAMMLVFLVGIGGVVYSFFR